MDQLTKDKLAINVGALPKMASAWVMTAAGVLGTIWISLTPDQQMQVIQHSPLPVWSYPIVLTVVGIIGRVWPQKILKNAEADAKSADPAGKTP